VEEAGIGSTSSGSLYQLISDASRRLPSVSWAQPQEAIGENSLTLNRDQVFKL
jgi:hypothetical protein